jgi:hypothetical protein
MVIGDKVLRSEQALSGLPSRDDRLERLYAVVWLLLCGLLVTAIVQWGGG